MTPSDLPTLPTLPTLTPAECAELQSARAAKLAITTACPTKASQDMYAALVRIVTTDHGFAGSTSEDVLKKHNLLFA